MTILTRDYGKLRLQIKGGLKSPHKLAGHLEPLTLTDISFARTKYGDTVIEALAVESFYGLKKQLEFLNLVLKGNKFLEGLIFEGRSENELYFLVLEWWWRMKDFKTEKDFLLAEFLSEAFAWQVLKINGVFPETQRCLVCGEILNEKEGLCFEALAGGFRHERCGGVSAGGEMSAPGVWNLIRNFLEQPLDFWARAKNFSEDDLRSAQKFLNNFICCQG